MTGSTTWAERLLQEHHRVRFGKATPGLHGEPHPKRSHLRAQNVALGGPLELAQAHPLGHLGHRGTLLSSQGGRLFPHRGAGPQLGALL